MIKKLLSYVKEYKLPSIFAPFFVACEVVMEVLIPFMMTKIVSAAEGNAFNELLAYGGYMVLMALCSLAFGVLSGTCAARAGMGFSKNLRKGLFESIENFSFSNIDKFSTSSLITRQTTDVVNIQTAYMMSLRMMVRSPLMLIGGMIMAFSIAPEVSWIFLIAIPLIALGIGLLSFFAFPKFRAMFKAYDKMNAGIQENLISIRVVKAFVRGDYETAKFKKTSKNLMDLQMKAETAIIFVSPILTLGVYVTTLLILGISGTKVANKEMEITSIMALTTYVMQILMSLMMLSMVVMYMTIAKESAERIVEVLDEKPSITDENANPDLKVEDGSIQFENVNFSYAGKVDTPYALENINLSIKSGETVGIIGGTGSSKTTLVQLIPRLYDATTGDVLVGGHSVKDYKIHTLRDSVAMVLQKNVLFSGTIKENLLWGDEHATDEEIEDACKSAQAHDFIMSFPDGYNTDLGQGGVNVSGGQKQRLCIARALIKKPKIMILDDSTSAVDTATDAKIRQAFKEKLADMTVIIIAQRISSIEDADKIIVLDDGKINAIGTHEQLMATNEIYREVAESQKKGE